MDQNNQDKTSRRTGNNQSAKKKRKVKRGRLIAALSVLVIILLVGLFLIVKAGAGKSSAKSPQSTNASNGYLEKSSQAIASGTATIVDDAGDPQWLQVKSKTSGDKFTDLSRGQLVIYKVNNPKVLKTAHSLSMQSMKLADVVAKYPNALIMNASGFNFATGVLTGFQINNGKLFQDWGEGVNALTAFVLNKDGSSKTYDSTTPASTILKNGAIESYSFGKILIKDGVVAENDGSVNWEIHSFIGNDKDNNLYLIISDTSAGYDNIMSTLATFNLQNLVLMDGGGSSQMALKGQTIYPSQDDRGITDFIVLQ